MENVVFALYAVSYWLVPAFVIIFTGFYKVLYGGKKC